MEIQEWTGTDRNGPERTGMDTGTDPNGQWNGPERTGMDFHMKLLLFREAF